MPQAYFCSMYCHLPPSLPFLPHPLTVAWTSYDWRSVEASGHLTLTLVAQQFYCDWSCDTIELLHRGTPDFIAPDMRPYLTGPQPG